MPSRTIDLKDVEAWMDTVIVRHREAALRGLVSAAARAVQEIKTLIIPNLAPEPSGVMGVYKAGWNFEPTDEGADIFNDVPHAIFVEQGVKASDVRISRAMIDNLEAWVVAKGIAEGNSPRRVAFAIALSQKARGIFVGGEGHRVLEKIGMRLPKIIQTEVASEIKKELG